MSEHAVVAHVICAVDPVFAHPGPHRKGEHQPQEIAGWYGVVVLHPADRKLEKHSYKYHEIRTSPDAKSSNHEKITFNRGFDL